MKTIIKISAFSLFMFFLAFGATAQVKSSVSQSGSSSSSGTNVDKMVNGVAVKQAAGTNTYSLSHVDFTPAMWAKWGQADQLLSTGKMENYFQNASYDAATKTISVTLISGSKMTTESVTSILLGFSQVVKNQGSPSSK